MTPGPTERYELTWFGKRAALAEAQTPARGTLRKLRDGDDDGDGDGDARQVLVRGDNLDALKLLEPEYGGRVRLVYIDPPYNTGEPFVYADTFGGGHDAWLSMMAPRLILARRMLRDDGVLFVSIDEHEHANLTLLLREIFGEDCHLGDMVWKKKSGGASQAFALAVDHEYIVAFGKTSGATLYDDPWANVSTRYSHTDERGRYALERLDKQNLGYHESLDFPIEAPDGRVFTVQHKDPARKRARWRWNRETVAERYDELFFRGRYVYTRNYEKDGGGARPRSLLTDGRFGRNRRGRADLRELFGGDVMTYPKPLPLMEHLVRIGSGPSDVVMDFFAGSASTAHAVLTVNAEDGGARTCVSVQNEEPCREGKPARQLGFETMADLCEERIRRAGAEPTVYEVASPS